MRKRLKRVSLILLALGVFSACATSPLGRRQLHLFPAAKVDALGAAAFQTLTKDGRLSADRRLNRYVRCIIDAVTDVAEGPSAPRGWDVAVFDDEAANAFALPGGKIGVNTGLLEIARNQHQLAVVLGHEVAHVLSRHANERLSTDYVTHEAIGQLAKLFGDTSAKTRKRVLAVLGVGSHVGVVLPFGRRQESEADIVGLRLMARAGFDPRESIVLWKRMAEAERVRPPEFLSTHPAPQTRIQTLTDHLQSALALREEAQRQGKRPECR